MKLIFYKNSVLATIISLTGSIITAAGVVMLFSGVVIQGVGCALPGVALVYVASVVSDKKAERDWKKKIKDSGLEGMLANDASIAIEIYNSNPGPKTLEYISTINPSAAEMLQQLINNKKNASETNKYTQTNEYSSYESKPNYNNKQNTQTAPPLSQPIQNTNQYQVNADMPTEEKIGGVSLSDIEAAATTFDS